MSNQPLLATKRPAKRRSCLGCLGRLFVLLLWTLVFFVVAAGVFLLSFFFFPPFGKEQAARILICGLDQQENGVSRSDTIMLLGVKLDGSGATLLSIPRDARVSIPDHDGHSKINAAYADGKETLLRETLRQPDVMDADLPYYITFESKTVARMIDALGGIDVNVSRAMDYDDDWGHLHIHLKKGNRHLDGVQAVGYLRWRKNNNGRGASDDFSRTERQREVMAAIKDKLRSWSGIKSLPKMLTAFRKNGGRTNLTTAQLLFLAWNSRKQLQAATVPGEPHMIGGVSYVVCDWEAGRELWQKAVR